jgi:rhodanese-related sulfurtransferase
MGAHPTENPMSTPSGAPGPAPATDSPAPPTDEAGQAGAASAGGGPDPALLEISLSASLELCRLGMGTLVDIRQAFELDMKGTVPGAEHIPLFEVKRMLGHALSEDEQDILDAGRPTDIDMRSFIRTINRLHHGDHLLLVLCNSGRRSLYAADLLRDMGYRKALSVAGGYQAWKKLMQGAVPTVPAAAEPPAEGSSAS